MHCTVVYVRLIHNGGAGVRELNQREGKRGNKVEYRSQSWVENTNMSE
jgi:hypothetical protein